jgi:hypothetical protein
LGATKIEHNSFTTSDEQSGRKGDFFVGGVRSTSGEAATISIVASLSS